MFEKLRDLMLCFFAVLIAVTIIPLIAITFPIWVTVFGVMRILSDRHPRFKQALQGIGIVIK